MKRPTTDKYLKGDPINAPTAVRAAYQQELRDLIEEIAHEVVNEISAWSEHPDVKEFYAEDDSPASQARILTNSIISKFLAKFSRKAKTIADRFTKRSNEANKASVHSSIRKLTGNLALPAAPLSPAMQEVLTAATAENVSLIKSIGSEYLGKVQQSVLRSLSQGTNISQLVKDINKLKGVSLRRAQIIAYDQTHKISNALSRERFKRAGLKKYIWRHTGGSNEPRPLHVHYDGRTFEYDTPVLIQKAQGKQPEVYGFPGTLINCSCRMQPVLGFDDEE